MSVRIIEYSEELKNDFKELNLEWIEKYFVVEQHDRDQLEHADEHIIAGGGRIFFAQDTETNEILGTVALIKETDQLYEIAKMAVAPKARGKKIGKLLMQHLIDAAKNTKGVNKIYLESNTVLVPAITMYRSFGFQEIKDFKSLFERANIKMELSLL